MIIRVINEYIRNVSFSIYDFNSIRWWFYFSWYNLAKVWVNTSATSSKLKYVCCCTLKFKNQILGLGLEAGSPASEEGRSGEYKLLTQNSSPSMSQNGGNTSLIGYLCLIWGRIFLVIGLVNGGEKIDSEPLYVSEQNFTDLGRFRYFIEKQINDSWLSLGPLISHIPECPNEKEKRKPNTQDFARIYGRMACLC